MRMEMTQERTETFSWRTMKITKMKRYQGKSTHLGQNITLVTIQDDREDKI